VKKFTKENILGKKLKGIIYKLHVTEGALDLTHGAFTTIQEVYVPDKGICFNSKGFAFKTKSDRYNVPDEQENLFKIPPTEKLKEIEISDSLVEKIEGIVNQRNTINEISEELFDMKVYTNADDEDE
jgi:hypothetical protein